MKVAAVVPAAGLSRRMGRPKLLLPVAGKPVVRWVLDALAQGGAEEIVLVLGPGGETVKEAVAGLSCRIAWNRDPASDMAQSIRIGLDNLSPSVTHVLTGPSDLPLLRAGTVRALTDFSRESPEAVVQPIHRGKKGHPILFPRAILEEIRQLATLRHVLDDRRAHVHLVEVEGAGAVTDLDTPEDYEGIRAAVEEART